MREKAVSMMERPLSQQYHHDLRGKNIQQIERKMSLTNSQTAIAKMDFNEKLERYKVLLEKEYEIRSRLSKEYGSTSPCMHRRDDKTVICNCGRRISTATGSPLCLLAHGHLAPPAQAPITRYRSSSEKLRRSERIRPLSADISLEMSSAAALRKLATEQKMGKRRESLKSLQDDFDKAKSLMARARACSNGNIDFDNNNNSHSNTENAGNNDTTTNNSTNNENKNNASNFDIQKEDSSVSKGKCSASNDSGHFSSNESIASNSSQEMSNAVSKYIAVRSKKERPLSSYL